MKKFAGGLLVLLSSLALAASTSVNTGLGASASLSGQATGTSSSSVLLDFSSSSQFTYSSSDVVFASGSAMLKNQFASDVVFAATFNSDLNGVYSRAGGSLTSTTTGTITNSGGKADFTAGGAKHLDFDPKLNCPLTNALALRYKITPNWTGSPSDNQYITEITGNPTDDTNRMIGAVATDGHMYWQMSALNNVSDNVNSAWSPTSGNEYEIEEDVNFTTGDHRLFIDGTVHNSRTGLTGTRNNACGLMRVGDHYDGATGNVAAFKIRDLVYFDAVQHTTTYTPGYSIPSSKYLTTDPVITQTTGVSISTLVGISGGTTSSGSDSVKFCLYNGSTNYYYSSGWTTNASCDSTHSSSLSSMNTNAATLSAGTYQVKAVLHSADGSTTPAVSSVSVVYQ